MSGAQETQTGVRYNRYGRMAFHPDYHSRHKMPWKTSEERYLIENYVEHGPEVVAAALGRTIGVVMTRACALRKEGKMPKATGAPARHRRAYADRQGATL